MKHCMGIAANHQEACMKFPKGMVDNGTVLFQLNQ
jgi:hypothetical protein